jgi:uncharacterized membrane protein
MTDKTPLSSKKFIAFFISMLMIAGVIITTLFTQAFAWPLFVFMGIGMLGLVCLPLGYILNQRKLDSILATMNKLVDADMEVPGTSQWQTGATPQLKDGKE